MSARIYDPKVRQPTSSPIDAQNELLTYLLRSSLMTSLPSRLSTELRLITVGPDPYSGELSPPFPLRISADGDCKSPPFSSTCAPRLVTTPSSFFNLASNSASGGLRLLRGARPGPGKTHSMPALVQLLHGSCLLHLTFRRRHVTQLRGLRWWFGVVFEVALEGSSRCAASSAR